MNLSKYQRDESDKNNNIQSTYDSVRVKSKSNDFNLILIDSNQLFLRFRLFSWEKLMKIKRSIKTIVKHLYFSLQFLIFTNLSSNRFEQS